MGLSRKLRDRIYKYCLVVPGNIVHYPEYYSHDKLNDYNDRKLTGFLSLLYVSKQIHDEAAPIFYGKNTFPRHGYRDGSGGRRYPRQVGQCECLPP